jgi:hypothetical protein
LFFITFSKQARTAAGSINIWLMKHRSRICMMILP